jgi:hypothetical protein
MAIYQCRQCQRIEYLPRHYRFHIGPYSRCPSCGTFRISRLKEPDKIDRMNRGLLNFAEHLAGGRIFHCNFCRIQFYDRRSLAPESPPPPPQSEVVSEGQPSQPLEQ